MEWTDANVRFPVPIGVSPDGVRRPLDLSATVCIEIYASFEFQPMLGAGELLRKVTITMEQLLDRSAKGVREWDGTLYKGPSTHAMIALAIFPKDGEVASPCSSVLVTVKRQKSESSDSSASRVLGSHCVSRRLVSARSSLIGVCPIVTTKRAGRCNRARPQRSLALPRVRGKTRPEKAYRRV